MTQLSAQYFSFKAKLQLNKIHQNRCNHKRIRTSSLEVSRYNRNALWMLLVLLGTTNGITQADVILVSSDANGNQINGESRGPSISADGRLVAFSIRNLSEAGEFDQQAYLKDMNTGKLVLMSENAAGERGNGVSIRARISADGRFVAFQSDADNLVQDDTNNETDIFVKSVQTGEIVRVSEDSEGAQVQGHQGVWEFNISADGRFVVFDSRADNIVEGDTNGFQDVFVKDLQNGSVIRVSENARGVHTNSVGYRGNSYAGGLSADGRYVAFRSHAADVVRDDTNDEGDVFVKDMQDGNVVRVSEDVYGIQANDSSGLPSISADGRLVAFQSQANNLVQGDTNEMEDVFVKNLISGEVIRVSEAKDGLQGRGESYASQISSNGNFVAFSSAANNLVPNDNCYLDIFLKNLETAEIIRISEAHGEHPNSVSYELSVSSDERFVAFMSQASNLASDDGDRTQDIFRADVVWPNKQPSPLNLRYSVYNNSVVEIFWNRIGHHGGVLYEITRNAERIGAYDSLSILEQNLHPNLQYRYTVNAIDGNGISSATDSISVATNCIDDNPKPSNPNKPSNLSYAVYSGTAAEIFWELPSDTSFVAHYEITRDGDSGIIRDGQSAFYDDLVPGKTYVFAITAISSNGKRSASASIQLTTDGENSNNETVPSTPQLHSKVYSNTAAELFWERSTDDGLVVGYEVVRNGESRGVLDVLSVFDSDLTLGMNYIYEITAVDNEGIRSVTSSMLVTSGRP